MTNWKEYKLSDLMEVIGGGTPKTKISEYWDGDIPWLSVVDFGNAEKKVFDTEKKITELGLNNSSTKILKKGQIIISARGTVGELAVLGSDMAFNQSCYGLNAKSEICTNDFLYYLMKCKISELKRNAHGAVFDTITRNTFETISASVPDIDTQTAIAEILSSLDDKIELNNKINQELENLAQTLFKQWFIDFEFPNENGEPYKSSGGEMVESELGEIPKGWEVKSLDEIGKLKMGQSPKSDTYNEDGIGKPLLNGAADYSNGLIFPKKFTSNPIRVNEIDDLVFCIRATIGNLVFADDIYCLGRGVASFRATDDNNQYFTYQLLNSSFEKLKSQASGSVILGLTKDDINNIKFPYNNQITNKYGEITKSFFQMIKSNRYENQELTNLRDTLLPKLISGELEVADVMAEKI